MSLRCLSEGFLNFLWIQIMILCIISAVSSSENTEQNDTLYDINNSSTTEEIHQDLSDYVDMQDDIVDILDLMLSQTINSSIDTFPWDNIVLLEQFQVTYCARVCSGSHLSNPRSCSTIKCFPCRCNQRLCQHYGTCCPGGHELPPSNSSPLSTFDNSSITSSQQSDVTTNKSTVRFHHIPDANFDRNFKCDSSPENTFMYIRSCPSNYPESHVKTRCEIDVPRSEQDLVTFLRVTDVRGLTYFNKYCAICNDASDIAYWGLRVNCSHYMNVYRARTSDDLLRLALALDSRCHIDQRTPDNVSLHQCRNDWIEAIIVDSCNMTGEWDIYDEDLERACKEISGITNRVKLNEQLYKNIFCALCNTNKFQNVTPACDPGSIIHRNRQHLPFSMLLNFGSREDVHDHKRGFRNCSHESEWTSPDNLCLPLQCSSGKILIHGGCSTAMTEIRGLVYKIQVVYLVNGPAKSLYCTETTDLDGLYDCASPNNYLENFLIKIEAILSNIALTIGLTSSVLFERINSLQNSINLSQVKAEANESLLSNCSYQFRMNQFTLDGFVLSDSSLSRDEVETFLIEQLITTNIHFDIGRNKSLTLTPILAPDRQGQYYSCPSARFDELTCNDGRLDRPVNENIDVPSKNGSDSAILLEPQLTCPFVSFNTSHYFYDSNYSSSSTNISIILYIGEQPMIISNSAELNMLSIAEDGTLNVCQTFLDMKIKNAYPDILRESSLLIVLQYVLTLVCLSVSILCLAVTLLTYSLFPVLRSVAGKNNMFLSGSLMLAQSSLLVASHIQQNGNLCTFFAILTHFLWLSKFCWCFTSCLHMFLTFTAKTRSIRATISSEKKYIINRVVTCSVVPALIVIAVVVTNHFTSEGRLIGYGQTTCSLDSPTLVGITLVTPLGVVLISNICFFTITVVKINNIRKLQTGQFQKDDRNDMYIYVKLSSVTGMFWILAIISEATDNDPLRFIAIPLNGLQGVFIFLSYICNKRVYTLYSRIYSRALGFENSTLTSAIEKSTIANVISDIRQPDMSEAQAFSTESNRHEIAMKCP